MRHFFRRALLSLSAPRNLDILPNAEYLPNVIFSCKPIREATESSDQSRSSLKSSHGDYSTDLRESRLENRNDTINEELNDVSGQTASRQPRKSTAVKDSNSGMVGSERSRDYNYERDDAESSATYADGAPRVMLVKDGSKDCIALLLDKEIYDGLLEIKAKRLHVDQMTRHLKNAKREMLALEENLDDLEGLQEIRQQARDLEIRRNQIEDRVPGLLEARQHVQELEAALDAPRSGLKCLQRTVQPLIELPLLLSKSLNPSPIPSSSPSPLSPAPGTCSQTSNDVQATLEALDEQQSNQESCYSSNDAQREAEEWGRRDRMERLRNELPEEAIIALEELEAARIAVRRAGYQFDMRKQHYAEDLAEYQKNYGTEPYTFSITEFDCKELWIGQHVTRNLIETEEELEEAEEQVKRLGVDPDYYRNMDWGSPPASPIDPEIPPALSSRVDSWLQLSMDIDDSDLAENETEGMEVDDWEAESVGICDSRSAVAFDEDYRKYIGRWRTACDQ